MNFYIDCEYITYTHRPKILGLKVGKPVLVTELISIALVDDNDNTYYAELPFNMKEAKKSTFHTKYVLPHLTGVTTPPEQVAEQIEAWIGTHGTANNKLIGYYSATDWTLFTQLWGGNWKACREATGFDYFTDLKALIVELKGWDGEELERRWPSVNAHSAIADARRQRTIYQEFSKMMKDEMQAKMSIIAHQSLTKLSMHVLNRMSENKDGSYTMNKSFADKVKDRASKEFVDLTPQQQGTSIKEANKYLTYVWDKCFPFFN